MRLPCRDELVLLEDFSFSPPWEMSQESASADDEEEDQQHDEL